jgi:transcription initiation factor TFIIB
MTELRLAADLVPEICAALSTTHDTEERAARIAEAADWHPDFHQTPTTLAAGAVYLAALMENEKVTQAEIADHLGTTTPTVSTTYRALMDGLDEQVIAG